MKADTFAKLEILDAVVEAEVGDYLRRRPFSLELFREEIVAHVSDLIDRIDVLDSVVAGRVYDAVVDFLAAVPEDEEGVVAAVLRFRRALDRIVTRGMDRGDLASASTWAIVLHDLLTELMEEYAETLEENPHPRELARIESLLGRANEAMNRLTWILEERHPEIREDFERLSYAVRYRRLRFAAVEPLARSLQRRVARYRPSPISRVGVFILRQLMRKEPTRKGASEARRRKRVPRVSRRRPGVGRGG